MEKIRNILMLAILIFSSNSQLIISASEISTYYSEKNEESSDVASSEAVLEEKDISDAEDNEVLFSEDKEETSEVEETEVKEASATEEEEINAEESETSNSLTTENVSKSEEFISSLNKIVDENFKTEPTIAQSNVKQQVNPYSIDSSLINRETKTTEDFLEESTLSMESQVDGFHISKDSDSFTLLPADTSGTASVTSYFALDTTDSFNVKFTATVQGQTYNFGGYADALSVIFTNHEDPFAVGVAGSNWGFTNLDNSFGIVWDFYRGNINTAMTDDNGAMTSAVETGLIYEAQATSDPKTLNFELIYNADTNTFTNIVTKSDGQEVARTTNFINGTQKFNTGLYPIKFASSSGAATAKTTVSNIEMTGSFVDYASLQNIDIKDENSKINWGETYTYSLGELNLVNGGQTINSTQIEMENLSEESASYTVSDYDGSVTQVDEKFTSGAYSNYVSSKGTSQILFDLTVDDPKEYSHAEQLALSNSRAKNYATVRTNVTFPLYSNNTISREFSQEIGGESASIDIEDAFYRDIDITNQAEVISVIEENITVTDPYLEKLSNEERINSNRYTYSGFQNHGTYSEITVNYLGVNGETVSKTVRVYDYQTALEFSFNINDATGERKIETSEDITYGIRINAVDSAIDIEGISFEATLDTRFLTTIGNDVEVELIPSGKTDISTANVHIDNQGDKLAVSIDKLYAGEYIDINYTTKAKDEFYAQAPSLVQDSIGGDIINIEVDTYKPYGYPNFGDLEAHSDLDLEKINYTTVLDSNIKDLGDSNNLLKSGELIELNLLIENDSYEVKNVVLSIEDLTTDFKGTIVGVDILANGVAYNNYTTEGLEITLADIDPNTSVEIAVRMQAESSFASTENAKLKVSLSSLEYDYLSRPKTEQQREIAKDIDANTNLTLSTQVIDETGDNYAQADEVLTYTASITNTGSIVAEDVFLVANITDENLDETSISDVTINVDGTTYAHMDSDLKDGLNTTAIDLLPNEKMTVTFNVKVKSSNIQTGGELEKDIIQEIVIGSVYYDNTTPEKAYITSTEILPINFSAEGMDEFELSHRLVSDSINNDGLAQANDVLSYELHLDNTLSAINYSNVILTLDVNNGLTDSISNINVTDVDGNAVDFTEAGSIIMISDLDAGASYILTYDITTPSTYEDLTPIISTITLVSDATINPMERQVTVEKDIHKDSNFDAVLMVEDAEANLGKAPINEEQILDLLLVEANDPILKDVTDLVVIEDFGGYDIISPKPGVYTITFMVTGANNNEVTSSAILSIIEDRDNAQLIVKDTVLQIDEAPKSIDELLTHMLVEASDAELGDISHLVQVVDFGGYNIDSPAIGTYSITMALTGVNGNTITAVGSLTVNNDEENDSSSEDTDGNTNGEDADGNTNDKDADGNTNDEDTDGSDENNSLKPMSLLSTGNRLILILLSIVSILIGLLVVKTKVKKSN